MIPLIAVGKQKDKRYNGVLWACGLCGHVEWISGENEHILTHKQCHCETSNGG